ncbi:hypothetical protein GCM10028817_09130 [Spirosoma pomorum]
MDDLSKVVATEKVGAIVAELADDVDERSVPLSTYVNDHGAVPVNVNCTDAVEPAVIVELPETVSVG